MNSFQRLRNFETEATVMKISGGIHIFSHLQLRNILFIFILYIFILSIAVFHSYWSQLHSRRPSVVSFKEHSCIHNIWFTFSRFTQYNTDKSRSHAIQHSNRTGFNLTAVWCNKPRTFSVPDSEEINRKLPVSFWLWKQKADLSSIIKDIFWLFSVLYKLTAVFLRKSL